MQAAGANADHGLLVALEVREPAIVGMSVLCLVRLVNRGPAPVPVSARLNLMEGDLALTVRGPDGAVRRLTGWQADTPLRRVTLAPGEEIVNLVNLLATDAGPVFPVPGSYEIAADFTYAPAQPALRSNPVAVTLRAPASEEEREVARLLEDGKLREAILLATPDSAPAALLALAQHAGTPDGRFAALLAADGVADDGGWAGSPEALESRSLAVAMLQTPFSRAGRALGARFADALRNEAAQRGDAALPDSVDTALRIAQRQPFRRK